MANIVAVLWVLVILNAILLNDYHLSKSGVAVIVSAEALPAIVHPFSNTHLSRFHLDSSYNHNERWNDAHNCISSSLLSSPTVATTATATATAGVVLDRRQLNPSTPSSSILVPTPSPSPSETQSPPEVSVTTSTGSAPTLAPPITAPRPSVKPGLLTDYEYENYWDPDPNTLRLGVLLSFNENPEKREAAMVRNSLS
ncbi:hypothetical protein BX616_000340, partial [Lobosporangium transversale]